MVRSSSTSWSSVLRLQSVESLEEHNYHALKVKVGQFMLVRWLEDETVSVMPLSAMRKDAIAKVKQKRRKLYDAEILKISGECSLHNI